MSAKFVINILSEIYQSTSETENELSSDFTKQISAQSRLKLIGAETVSYDNKKNHQTYVLVYLDIERALSAYTKQHTNMATRINTILTEANKEEKAGNLMLALKYYRKALPLLVEIGETNAILNILQRRSPFSELTENTSVILQADLTQVEVKLTGLLKSESHTIESGAYYLVEQLAEQVADINKSKLIMAVFPIQYRNTDFGSEFSDVFFRILQTELVSRFTVVDIENKQTKTKPEVLLTGTYWVDNQQVNIFITLLDSKTNTKTAVASTGIPLIELNQRGINIKPANFSQAMEDTKVFLSKDIISGRLSLEAWTNKGNKHLIFKEGAESTLLVRVNKPCYLQVLYHLADGMRLLMYNNLYVDVSKVNLVYAMPDTFEVYPPFGVERWQIFASTEKLPKLETAAQNIDGEYYDNILAQDLAKFTAKTRGMKKKTQKAQMAEKTITLTTIRNK